MIRRCSKRRLSEEYQRAAEMGLTEKELGRLVEQSFEHSFLSKEEQSRLSRFQPRN